MSPRLFAAGLCAVLVFVAFPGRLHAQDSGLPDRDSAEAQALIGRMQEIAGKEPDRAAEVNAYLRPLTREVAQSAKPEAPADEGDAPKSNPMILVRTPGGGTSAMRATGSEKRGAVLIVTTTGGSKAIVQAANVLAEVPWYSEEAIGGGRVDLEVLAQQYEDAIAAAPALRDFLTREATRFRKIVERKQAEADGQAAKVEQQVKQATSLEFDASSPPSPEEIVDVLEAAEAVVAAHPETANEIDAWGAPFRGHLGHLLAGDEWRNGKWVTAAERAAAAEKARAEQVRNELVFRVDGSVAPAAAIRKVFMIAVWSACALAVAALLCVVFARGTVRLTGVVVLALVPVSLATAFYLGSRDPAGLPIPPSTADESPVVDLLLAEHSDSQPMRLAEDSINAFLAKRLRMSPAAPGDTAARRGLVVRLQPDEIGVFELVRAFGFEWIVRYRFSFLVENGRSFVEPTEVWVGRLRCPGRLAGILVKSLEPALSDALESTKLLASYTPANPTDHEIHLLPVVAPKSEAKPAAQPSSEPGS